MRDDVVALGDEPENWITDDHSRSKRYKRDEKARVLEDEPDMAAKTPSNATLQAGPQENVRSSIFWKNHEFCPI